MALKTTIISKASIQTRDLDQIDVKTGNLYESLAIIGKRARQIAITTKDELNGKLAEFATSVDNLEEVFENREQIEISKFYEKLPKPTLTAFDEFLNDEILWKYKVTEEVKDAE